MSLGSRRLSRVFEALPDSPPLVDPICVPEPTAELFQAAAAAVQRGARAIFADGAVELAFTDWSLTYAAIAADLRSAGKSGRKDTLRGVQEALDVLGPVPSWEDAFCSHVLAGPLPTAAAGACGRLARHVGSLSPIARLMRLRGTASAAEAASPLTFSGIGMAFWEPTLVARAIPFWIDDLSAPSFAAVLCAAFDAGFAEAPRQVALASLLLCERVWWWRPELIELALAEARNSDPDHRVAADRRRRVQPLLRLLGEHYFRAVRVGPGVGNSTLESFSLRRDHPDGTTALYEARATEMYALVSSELAEVVLHS